MMLLLSSCRCRWSSSPGGSRDSEQREREREREDHLCIMTSSFEAPWIEKYRPELLSDVVGNAEAVSRLAAISQVKKKKKMMMIIADECQ